MKRSRLTDSTVCEARLSTRDQTLAAVHNVSVSDGAAGEARLDPSQIIDSVQLSEAKDLDTLTESIVASARQHGMINVDVIHTSSGTTLVFMSTADGEETIAFDYDENVGAACHSQHCAGKVGASGAVSPLEERSRQCSSGTETEQASPVVDSPAHQQQLRSKFSLMAPSNAPIV